ncbi:uncharacterized protein METZ01_LOCUS295554, partial [marine metagenome]
LRGLQPAWWFRRHPRLRSPSRNLRLPSRLPRRLRSIRLSRCRRHEPPRGSADRSVAFCPPFRSSSRRSLRM